MAPSIFIHSNEDLYACIYTHTHTHTKILIITVLIIIIKVANISYYNYTIKIIFNYLKLFHNLNNNHNAL